MAATNRAERVGRTPPEVCPVCGEDVSPGAAACPGCGADDATGWNEEATAADGLDLPDGEFDYDAFVDREFGGSAAPVARWKTWAGIALAVLTAIGLILVWVIAP